jgi:hypothetical protein
MGTRGCCIEAVVSAAMAVPAEGVPVHPQILKKKEKSSDKEG